MKKNILTLIMLFSVSTATLASTYDPDYYAQQADREQQNSIANEQNIINSTNQMENDFNASNAREHNWDTLGK
jgi:hypothetical protein